MYQQLGLSNELIAFYTSWFYLPWVIKPFWSPFVELLKQKMVDYCNGTIAWCIIAAMAFSIPTTFWLQSTNMPILDNCFLKRHSWHCCRWLLYAWFERTRSSLFVGIRNTFYKIASIFGKGFLVFRRIKLDRVRSNQAYKSHLQQCHEWRLRKQLSKIGISLIATKKVVGI